jgi:cytochrome c-type biogenesis protein CcmH
VRRLLLLATLVALLVPGAAAVAATTQPKFDPVELERELMCPTCKSPLYLSHSPAADRIRAYVADKAAQGWTKQQVKDALEADFGPSILAVPKAEGFGLAAWLVPIGAVLGGLVVAIVLAVAWRRRSRGSDPPRPDGGAALAPDLEARVDDALARFD